MCWVCLSISANANRPTRSQEIKLKFRHYYLRGRAQLEMSNHGKAHNSVYMYR